MDARILVLLLLASVSTPTGGGGTVGGVGGGVGGQVFDQERDSLSSNDGRPWVRILQPTGKTRIPQDEFTIQYATSTLPPGWAVRLSINGREALVSREISLTAKVPGLSVANHVIEVSLLNEKGERSGVHSFTRCIVSPPAAWLTQRVSAHGDGLSHCTAGHTCEFHIHYNDERAPMQNDDSSSNGNCTSGRESKSDEGPNSDRASCARAHVHAHKGDLSIQARLVGPAIVMCHVTYVGGGVYRAQYRAPEEGVYQMTVKLMFANGSGLADPGEGVIRVFVNGHVIDSPFTVHVTFEGSSDSSSDKHAYFTKNAVPVCRGRWGKGDCSSTTTATTTCSSSSSSSAGTSGDSCDSGTLSRRGWLGEGESYEMRGGRWVHRDVCAMNEHYCGQGGFPPGEGGAMGELPEWVWVPYGCVLRGYDSEQVRQCLGSRLLLSGTSLVRTMYYDLVCMLDSKCNATKEHEDLVFEGPPHVAFHWFARFADHTPFESPPLGDVDARTGRLRFNATIADLLAAIEREAPGEDDLVVLGTQIFDIMKAPMSDYSANMQVLLAALESVKAHVIWRTGEAVHDEILDANWDFSTRGGRYMNGPRMLQANTIASLAFRSKGYAVLDMHGTTYGRVDASHDGTHYYDMGVFEESGGVLRVGNHVSKTNTMILLNYLCNR